MDILGNSELKWTGMGEFNSDDPYTYYCGQESLRRHGVALVVNKRVWSAVLGYNLRNNRMSQFIFKANHSIWEKSKSVCQPIMLKKIKVLLWPTRPYTTNTQKTSPSHHRRLEGKSRKSRDTCSNRQVWPWSKKWNTAKANRSLPREHAGLSKHTLPTTQQTALHMDVTRWSILKSDWLHPLKLEKLYTVSRNKTWSWLAQIMSSLL